MMNELPMPGLGLHADRAAEGIYGLLDERKSCAASLALGREAALKNTVELRRCHACAAVIHAEEHAVLTLADADRHFLLRILRCAAQGVERIFRQIAEDGDQAAGRQVLSVPAQLAGRVEDEPNAQLGGAV